MLLCATRHGPSHRLCLHPPRPVVPDGDWHCHLCYEAPCHVNELRRVDPILLEQRGDPYHRNHEALLSACAQMHERAVAEYRSMLAAEDALAQEATSQHARERSETLFHPEIPQSLKHKIKYIFTQAADH